MKTDHDHPSNEQSKEQTLYVASKAKNGGSSHALVQTGGGDLTIVITYQK